MMNLTRREKAFVFGGISLLAVLLTLQFLVRPAMERMSTLRRVIAAKQQTLAELRAKSFDYRELKTEVSSLRFVVDQQDRGPGILSAVEQIRQTSGLSDNVLSLKPVTVAMDEQYQETVVEIHLESVTMEQLVRLLAKLESVEFAGGIKSLDVGQAKQDGGGLKVNMQVAVVSRVVD